jgi:glycerol uptake facilitator-like aquaporin
MTNTFAGIRRHDTAGFIVAQFAGAFTATWLFKWFIPTLGRDASAVLVEHDGELKPASDD